MIIQSSVRKDEVIYQVPYGPDNELDPFGDWGTLQLRYVRHVKIPEASEGVTLAQPDVKRWSLVSLKHDLPEKEITNEQAVELLENFFIRTAVASSK